MEEASDLGRQVLRDVSRSFYLSLRALPSGFREPASLGYLLARISDTVADTVAVPAATRVALLEEFRAVVRGGTDAGRFEEKLRREFVAFQEHAGERVLMENSAACVRWLRAIPGWQGDLIEGLLERITEGQGWDLTRFAGEGVVRLEEDAELERYAYLVAGSVGEFWTDLGFGLDPRFSGEDPRALRELGRRYGMGLQLVNILRDVPEDLEKGRCYLPGPGSTSPRELMEEMRRWRVNAAEWLAGGLRYAGAVRGRRMRFASGLPALLGLRTLERIDGARWEELAAGVKIPRSAVRRCAWQALVASLAGGEDRWSV